MGINLIPPQLKKERTSDTILNQIIFGFVILVILDLIFSAGLYAYDFFLMSAIQKQDGLIADQSRKAKGLKDIEAQVNQINHKVASAEDIVKKRPQWSQILSMISQATPKEVQIKTMEVSAISKVISVSGVALSREKIALFKEKLEREGFSNVIFASSTFNESLNNYSYSLTFELGDAK